MSNFLTWWALPALCVLFVCIQFTKYPTGPVKTYQKVSQFEVDDWGCIVFASVFWPLGALYCINRASKPIFKALCRFLTKDRKWL